MTKRRDVVRYLLDHGFKPDGGTKHEKFVNGSVTIPLKRHREVEDEAFESIKREIKRRGIR